MVWEFEMPFCVEGVAEVERDEEYDSDVSCDNVLSHTKKTIHEYDEVSCKTKQKQKRERERERGTYPPIERFHNNRSIPFSHKHQNRQNQSRNRK